MKLGIIAPIDNAEFIAEHTDFDAALGYMATRYDEYLRMMQGMKFMKRDIYLIQHPNHILREDYYLMNAQRLHPKYMAPTLQFSRDEQYAAFTGLLRAKGRNPELESTTVLPFINQYDDESNAAAYSEIVKHCFLLWNLANKVPLRVAHEAIIVGMPTLDVLRTVKPYAVITALPIIFAKANVSITEASEETATVLLYKDNLEPDWFFQPLSNDALALAVENIKELRNAVSDTRK